MRSGCSTILIPHIVSIGSTMDGDSLRILIRSRVLRLVKVDLSTLERSNYTTLTYHPPFPNIKLLISQLLV